MLLAIGHLSSTVNDGFRSLTEEDFLTYDAYDVVGYLCASLPCVFCGFSVGGRGGEVDC